MIKESEMAQPKPDPQMDLLQGTLDMLILKAASLGPLHGYGALLRIQQISGEQLQIQQGSLYPALYRLEHNGLSASEWGESENKRRATFRRKTHCARRASNSAASSRTRTTCAWLWGCVCGMNFAATCALRGA